MHNKLLKVLIVSTIAFLVIFVQHFPNLYASWYTPEGYTYNYQASWFDPWDVNVYVTAIRNGQEGNILLKNHYNSIPQWRPSFIYPLYTLAGHLSHANPYLIFHTLAIIVSCLTTVVVFTCYQHVFGTYKLAVLATIVCLLGGGVGALLGKTDISAASQITSFNFQSATQRAHEGIGVTIYIVALMTTFYYYEGKKTKQAAAVIIGSLLVGVVFYPYNILSYLLITFIYLYLKLRVFNVRPYALLFTVASIVGTATLIYYFHLHSTTFSAAASENLPNVPITSMLIGYGGFISFFVLHTFIEKSTFTADHKKMRLFLILWVSISIVLSYLPGLGFSRFYLRGLFFPLTGLMFLYLLYTKNHVIRYFLTTFSIILLLSSRLNIFILRMEEVKGTNPWLYTHNDVIDALDFLKTRSEDGVISHNYPISNFIPAYTGKRVYVGHMLQTPHAAERIALLTDFYLGKFSEEEAALFLKSNNITFVIYSDHFAGDTVPTYSFLKNVFKNRTVQIFTSN